MILRSVLAALALTASASAAAAQTTGVQPGARIRLTQPVFVDGVDIGQVQRPAVGTLVSIDSSSLTARMEKDGTVLTLPFSAVSRLQISQGAQSANRGSVRGMLKGAVIGGGLIAAFYGVANRTNIFDKVCEPTPDPTQEFDCSPGLPPMVPVIAGGTVAGAGIGFAMGSRQREAWRDVDPRFLPVVPRTGDLSLSVSLRF